MEISFEDVPGLVISESLPPATLKRRRLRTKWSETAPQSSDREKSIPFAVCLESDLCIQDVINESTSPTNVFTCSPLKPTEWMEKSALLRNLARMHQLYPIVVRGEKTQSKRCTHAALRRLEAIIEWQYETIYTKGMDTARDIVDRQIRHGLSRMKSRKWETLATPTRLVYTLPPRNIAEQRYDVHSVLEVAAQRTLRVSDVHGEELWLLPASTLNAILGPLAPPVASPLPGDVRAPFVQQQTDELL